MAGNAINCGSIVLDTVLDRKTIVQLRTPSRFVFMNKYQSNPLESLLASLYGRINYERQLKVTPRNFKLQNMREFMRRLGNPHLRYPVIHVAGTKGKGSVATMIGQILQTSGRKTGVYTSPHLESINQRMVVDGQQITDEQLAEVLSEIESVATEMDEEADQLDRRPLTFFEVTTAAAFCFFAKQKADAVVLEVGLGGRMDSTNVCQPLVSIITNISHDHTRQLGATLDKIAFEKAGIIKPETQVISGALDPSAATVIAEVAEQKRAPLAVLNRDFFLNDVDDSESDSSNLVVTQPNDFGVSGCVGAYRFDVPKVTLGLIGGHQQTNAAVAIAAIQSLNQQGWRISDQHVCDGLADARLAGRTELIATRPTVIIDIAHNAASIEALVATVKELPAWRLCSGKILIMATSREKDAESMLRPVLKAFDRIIFTKYQDNPRGRDAQELLQLARTTRDSSKDDSGPPNQTELSVSPTPVSAWEHAVGSTDQDGFICIAGSAFLVAELRPVICKCETTARDSAHVRAN